MANGTLTYRADVKGPVFTRFAPFDSGGGAHFFLDRPHGELSYGWWSCN
jgi:hypothetical protein